MMSKDNLISRDYDIVTMSDLGREFMRPETLMLQFDKKALALPFDIGALCYAVRDVLQNSGRIAGKAEARKVDTSTLLPHRRETIKLILDALYVSGYRDATCFGLIKDLRTILDWADVSGFSDIFTGAERAREAYSALTDYLTHSMLVEERIAVSTASYIQKSYIKICRILFGSDARYIASGAQAFVETNRRRASPSASSVERYVSFIVPFAKSLRTAMMNPKFPVVVDCGGYSAMIRPASSAQISSPYVVSGLRHYDQVNYRAYSYAEHCEYCECADLAPDSKVTFKAFEDSLERSSQRNSYYHVIWCQKVIRAYANIIQLITGMNASQLVSLEYTGALEVGEYKLKKELVEVKFRAGGKKVSYAIGGVQGLKVLREYLEFREWYLNGTECKWLFFCDLEGNYRLDEPVALRSDFQARLYKQLRGKLFAQDIENLSPSLARKYKSVLMQKLGLPVAAAAEALNHSVDTNRNHYSEPSIDDMEAELGAFWNAVEKSASAIKVVDADYTGDTDLVVGHCNDKGSPQLIETTSLHVPDCNKEYGCLYCVNYLIHADEEDIRKLLSLKYVVSAVMKTAVDFGRAEELFRELCLRVDAVLEQLLKKYPVIKEAFDRVKHEVDSLGMLTPFWETRLAKYERVGLVQ